MKSFRRFSALTALGCTLFTFALMGCQTIAQEDPDSQQVPWGQPASWEGTVPGMPGMGGGR